MDIVLAKCKQHNADKAHTTTSVMVVGMIPERAKVAGKLSMAGPVKELTAMESDPNIPMEP